MKINKALETVNKEYLALLDKITAASLVFCAIYAALMGRQQKYMLKKQKTLVQGSLRWSIFASFFVLLLPSVLLPYSVEKVTQ